MHSLLGKSNGTSAKLPQLLPSLPSLNSILTISYTVLLVLLVTVALSVLAWNFAPKENRTVFRSSVILGLTMCYLMWAITYLAQLHPLEAPRRSDLRQEA